MEPPGITGPDLADRRSSLPRRWFEAILFIAARMGLG